MNFDERKAKLAKLLGNVGAIWDGGGFSGANSTGFYKATWEFGIRPFYHHGVSIGALLAAKAVEQNGDPHEMEEHWREMEELGPSFLFSRWKIPFRVFHRSYFDNTNLQKLVDRLDLRKIIESPQILSVVAMHEKTRKQRIFTNRDTDVLENPRILRNAILASMSIMGVFDPVMIQGDEYSDGLSFDLDSAVLAGCNTLFILGNSPKEVEEKKRERAFARLLKGSHAPISFANGDRIRALRRRSNVTQEYPPINRELKEENKKHQELVGALQELHQIDDLNWAQRRVLGKKIEKLREIVAENIEKLESIRTEFKNMMRKKENEMLLEHTVKDYNFLPTLAISKLSTTSFSRRRKDLTKAIKCAHEQGMEFLENEFADALAA